MKSAPANDLRHVLPIQLAGEAAPLFFVAGGGGGEIDFRQIYAGLLAEVGSHRPVYGVIATGAPGTPLLAPSVPELAAACVRDMIAVQPVGPYLLAGEALGGRLAFEMARQLVSAGEKVPLLALLNSVFYGQDGMVELTSGFRLRRAWHRTITSRWRQLRRLSPSRWLSRLWLMVRNAGVIFAPLTPEMQEARRTRGERWTYVNLLHAYKPTLYRGRVLLLLTADRVAQAQTWNEHVEGQIVERIVPGDRSTYLDEHAPDAAVCLLAEIDAAIG